MTWAAGAWRPHYSRCCHNSRRRLRGLP